MSEEILARAQELKLPRSKIISFTKAEVTRERFPWINPRAQSLCASKKRTMWLRVVSRSSEYCQFAHGSSDFTSLSFHIKYLFKFNV